MKKHAIAMFLVAALVCALLPQITLPANAADITINATNFPDDNFRAYVREEIDKDGNNKLSASEISNAIRIDVSSGRLSRP